MKFATRLQQLASEVVDQYGAMATPIYQTATFEQESADMHGAFDYSRSGNPTRKVLEDQVAALEGGAYGFAFASGMAATTAITRLLRPGDEILADWDVYGGTSRLFGSILERANIRVRYLDATDLQQVRDAINPATKLIFAESPTNPLLRILDLRGLGTIAKEAGLLFAVDNSTMSPYLQNPLELGAHVVMHSATKFLGGHSDTTGGILVANDEAIAKELRFVQNSEGTALGPLDCFLLLRGLKTLKLRMDAQQTNAMKIAEALTQNAKVQQVFFPGLATHARHELHAQQARGGGSVISFRASSPEEANRIAKDAQLFAIAVSFGSTHSTISVPHSMSHASVPAALREQRGLPLDLVRLSIGVEDVDDLLEDLSRTIG
ncbi:trans-sulfuration enzyme family protein [Granulicella cerasi]|uniref:Trans-sulfuration enzyme family protein n=1 Tax=Granulicella cerasi TaxID=741063 RepID=A0ABW1ZAZ3_9BACT|nr:PLP-dependent aspartate aminotransferase family protein [Granulicella cerasi]